MDVPSADRSNPLTSGPALATSLSASGTSPGLSPAPVPEGMETTAEDRARWTKHDPDPVNGGWLGKLVRDLDRALAENTRQSAEITRLGKALKDETELHRLSAAALKSVAQQRDDALVRVDEWKRAADDLGRREAAARAEEREACATLVQHRGYQVIPDQIHDTVDELVAAIRARTP